MDKLYDWKRFWYPRGSSLRLDNGFLYDPDTSRFFNEHIVPFDDIASIQCLILLSEPGMGKSTTLYQVFKHFEAKNSITDDEMFYFDLHDFGSEDRLIRTIFSDEAFRRWLVGTHNIHLFLDSFDEGHINIPNLAALLAGELRKYTSHNARLFLRLTCRTAEWPSTLETNLKKIWKADNNPYTIGIYELAPLRAADVAEAIRTNNGDPDKFFHQIEQMRVVPLASRPVTLNLLINLFIRDGYLPGNQTNLYYQGCRLLCDETNEKRREGNSIGSLSSDQKVRIAARIAAITIFGNYTAIWRGIDQGDVPHGDVPNHCC
jgi:hypothetical protein